MSFYEITQESDQELKNFRIKLIELFVLTLTAIFALLTLSKNLKLLYPALAIVLDLIIVVIALICSANKNKMDIEFDKNQNLVSPIKMVRMSYEFTCWEYLTLTMYGLAIIAFFILMI
jgi:hypothetical protein